MPTLEEVRRLSPSALAIYKQQAYRQARAGDPYFSRLVRTPEYQSIMGLPEQEGKPWWQHPLDWMRGVEKGAGAILTAPFTPRVAGTENLPWFEREKAEYEAWDEPSFETQPLFRLPWTPEDIRERPWKIGVKGVVEQVPWFATAIASGGLGALGWAGAKTGVGALTKAATFGRAGLKPIMAVEKAVATAPFKAVGAMAKPFLPKNLPNIARFTAPVSEEFEKQITKQDWQRHIAQTFGRQPFLKSITEKVGGRAATVTEAVEDQTARALLIAPRVVEVLLSKGNVALANLRKISQNPVQLFRVDEATGMAKGVGVRLEGASRHIADIAEHPANYTLSATQKSYIEQLHNIEDWVLDGLKESGIDVKQLKFDEFSHWVHRAVIGKNIDEELVKITGGIGKRIGAKASWEKTRFYRTAAEGVKAGIIYEPSLDNVANLYIQTAAKRIGDQRIAEMTRSLGQTALERATGLAPEVLKTATQTAKSLAGAKQLIKVTNRAIRGEKLTEATLQAQERRFPELGKRLRGLVEGKAKKVTPEVADRVLVRNLKTNEMLVVSRSDIEIRQTPLGSEAWYQGQRVAKPASRAELIKEIQNFEQLAKETETTPEKLYGIAYKRAKEELTQLEVAIPKAEVTLAQKLTELKSLLKEAKLVEESAKSPYWKAKAERAVLMERARTPTLGTESTIWHPAFQGKIYPKEVAGEIQKYFDDMGWSPLNKLATLSGEMRTLVAAADFSAGFIQGLPSMGRYPVQWGKAIIDSFKAWGNPASHQDFLIKHIDNAMELANNGGFIGGFEYMEAMPQIQRTFGLMARLTTGRPEIGKQIARQTYGRFEASFGAFGDALRVYLWDALKSRAKNPEELQEIARHINRMTGVMSQNALGLGKTQKVFEQAFLFFAPRYTRAGFALVGDAFKGGITGAETRKSLGSMMAAGALMYYGTAKALGQEPNFDPSNGKFMTIEITDPITGIKRHFGVGGMMTSLARFAADVTASAIGAGQNEPLDFVKLSRFDNPFIKFMYSKSAPLTGFMEGMLFGQNYFGEPFENPGDYAKFLGEQVLPIALQSTLMEEGGLSPTGIAGEMVGLRTFPESDWEKRNSLRDQIAQQTYDMSWQDVGMRMGELAQRKLENQSPELQALTQKAQETSSKIARGEGKVWDMWRKEGQAIEDSYRRTITLASQEYEVTGDGVTFRDKVDQANAIKRDYYATRERDPQYAEIYSYFNEPLSPSDMAKMNPNDLARKEYYQLMYSPDMYDQYGNYNFELADQKEAYFIQKYGQKAVDYIEEFAGSKWEEPMAMKVLREARQTLEPYWEIETQIWSQYPPELQQVAKQIDIMDRTDPNQADRMLFQYPQIVYIRKQIAFYKKRLKLQRPDIAQALRTFYTY